VTKPAVARRTAIAVAALLTPILLMTTAVAQQQTSDLAEASLEELSNIQVYSASKHMQGAREAPSSVTVVTADEIQKYGYRTLADILRSVRGFYMNYDRNYSYLGVRGFARPGDYNTRILLLIDGHRINDNVYDQAMLGTEFPLDVDLIERVEIIRGPSSSLYGTNAFFAVINVITRKPGQLNGWELSFEPSSFDTYKGRATYGGKYKAMDMFLSGSFYDSQGQTLFYPEFDTPATNHGVVRHADDDQYDDFLATVGFRGLTLQGVFSSREKGIPTGAFDTVFGDPRTRTIDSHGYVDVSYQRSLVEKWDLFARTSIDQVRYDGIYVDTSPVDGSVVLNKDFARGTWWGGELKLSRTLLKRHKLTLGSELRDNVQQDQGNYDISPRQVFVDSRRSSWIWALYAQDEFAISRKLTFSAGLRHDRYYSFGGTTNPRFGLIYHPLKETTLKLLYGAAFRAPNVYEMFYGGLPNYKSNPDLRPEAIASLEAVGEQKLGRHFQMTGTAFHNRIDRLISQETDPDTGLLIFRNSQRARATGAEIELTGRFLGGLQGRVSYGYVEAENSRTNQLLTNAPRHRGKLNLIVPLVKERLFASLDAQYIGSRATLAENLLDGFPIFNVTLLGHALGKHLDLSTSVYNLMDKKYFDPGGAEHRQDALQQDGRNFRLKLTARF
jgi:outer membrane receptor for ferrienterochelin and colicins